MFYEWKNEKHKGKIYIYTKEKYQQQRKKKITIHQSFFIYT